MWILRPVQVKARVTPRLRTELMAETNRAISQVEEEIQRIRAKKSSKRKESPERSQEWLLLEKEEAEMKSKKEALLNRLRDIEMLKDGQEIVSNQVQSIQNVEVGDIWPFSENSEIVLEDGRVVAIRHGNSVTVSIPPDEEGVPGGSSEGKVQ